MSQGWANSTLGLEWAKFSELSVHHSTVTLAVGTVTSAQCRRGLSALCPSAPLRLPMELVPTRTCFCTGAQNATCPQGQADLLGFFFSFFTSYSLVGSRLGEEWRAPLNFPVTQHHCQPRFDIYLRWIKLTCHHQLNVSASKFSFCDVPDLYIWNGQVTAKKTLFRDIK